MTRQHHETLIPLAGAALPLAVWLRIRIKEALTRKEPKGGEQ